MQIWISEVESSDPTSRDERADFGPLSRSVTFRSDGLILDDVEAAMEYEALRQGLSLSDLLQAAGQHFCEDRIVPAPPPSAVDLAILVNDELRTSDI